MPPLHVEPDQLHLASRSFWHANYQFEEKLFALRMARYRLELAWQGGNAEEYLLDLGRLLDGLQNQSEDLLSFGLLLARQADAWEESDQRWTGAFLEDAPLESEG